MLLEIATLADLEAMEERLIARLAPMIKQAKQVDVVQQAPEEWLTTQQAMDYLGLKSETAFKKYRQKHLIDNERVGKQNMYAKSKLIKK